jgi:rhamnosyltransferase subunit B
MSESARMGHRIVITSWGSFGDVYPYVGLARALQSRGHRPVLAVPRYYAPIIEREGLECRPVGPDVDPNDRAMFARVMHPTKGPEAIVRDWVMPAVSKTYAELTAAAHDADLIVSHPATYAAPILAEKRGLPWVSTVLSPMSFFSVTDFPALPASPGLVHLRRLGPWVGRLFVRLAHHVTRDWSEPVHRLRAELGLPRGANPIYEGQFSPLLTLALFSRAIGAPQPDWPARTRVTGFVFYNGSEGLSPELEAFLDAGPPPVVFTLGSSAVGAAGSFYEESAAATARLGIRAVLLTGGFADNLPRVSSPNILLVDRAPHQLLFPRASAIVHQGGIGTTGQALRAGKPMLVVPYSHDQPDNAFRVRSLGVSRTVFPPAYRAARVARELEQLLREPAYRATATIVADEVKAEGGAAAAADAIGDLIGTPARSDPRHHFA